MVSLGLVFVARFLFVYLLGVQTMNVVQKKWIKAFFVSAMVGMCEFAVLGYVVRAIQEDGGLLIIAVAILGGSAGISTAIFMRK